MSDFIRSSVLNNIPEKKIQLALEAVDKKIEDLQSRATMKAAINRYAESNIPTEYWYLKMERDFKGDVKLISKYQEYTANLENTYTNGESICFAGKCGVGKTLTMSCILKKAALKGFSCLYTSISDIVNALTQSDNDAKFSVRRELAMVDFLVIDEFDNRFFGKTDSANELFARSFESVVRARLQNNLPVLIATNSPNIQESFVSFFKESLGSLMNKISIFYVSGEDYRKQSK